MFVRFLEERRKVRYDLNVVALKPHTTALKQLRYLFFSWVVIETSLAKLLQLVCDVCCQCYKCLTGFYLHVCKYRPFLKTICSHRYCQVQHYHAFSYSTLYISVKASMSVLSIIMVANGSKNRFVFTDSYRMRNQILDSTLEANNFWKNEGTSKWCPFLKSSMTQLSKNVYNFSVASSYQKLITVLYT